MRRRTRSLHEGVKRFSLGRQHQTLSDRLASTGLPAARRPVRAVLVAAIGVGIVVVLTAVIVVVTVSRPTGELHASSTAVGTSAEQLLTGPITGARPVTWRSADETTGAQLTFSWPSARTVGHIAWRAAQGSSIRSALAQFGDGSSILLTSTAAGDVDVQFPSRQVSRIQLTVTAVRGTGTSVALAGLRADGGAPAVAGADDAESGVVVTASSSSSSSATSLSVLAAFEGNGSTGAGWQAAASDEHPWVELSWPTSRQLTSLQMFGSSTARSPSRGTLQFSDGSSLRVGAIRDDRGLPTTVGFAPRMVRSVRLVFSEPEVGLDGLRAYGVGQTPGRGTVADPDAGELSLLSAADCSTAAARPSPPAGLVLICPATGSTVNGSFSVAVSGPARRALTVEAYKPFPGDSGGSSGTTEVIARARLSKAGLARLILDSAKLPSGPLNLAVRAEGVDQALVVQVMNLSGQQGAVTRGAVAGRTLLWQDDFTRGLSASVTGESARYAATKPEREGPAEFGDAIFADPDWDTGNVGVVDGGYLRLRLSPKGDLPQTESDSRTQLGGIISSAGVGGDGLSVQYGYFEARMLGAPGLGTWPAFWMLSNSTLVDQAAPSGEVDAVELYGNDTAKACSAVHSYSVNRSKIECRGLAPATNWSLQWHTYGVDIGPRSSRFFIDGRLVTTIPGPSNADDPYFFLLNLASGGGWPVDLSPTDGISDMYVDWVKVYS